VDGRPCRTIHSTHTRARAACPGGPRPSVPITQRAVTPRPPPLREGPGGAAGAGAATHARTP
jgi:hypothetical protein